MVVILQAAMHMKNDTTIMRLLNTLHSRKYHHWLSLMQGCAIYTCLIFSWDKITQPYMTLGQSWHFLLCSATAIPDAIFVHYQRTYFCPKSQWEVEQSFIYENVPLCYNFNVYFVLFFTLIWAKLLNNKIWHWKKLHLKVSQGETGGARMKLLLYSFW